MAGGHRVTTLRPMANVHPFRALRYSSMGGSELSARLLAHPSQVSEVEVRHLARKDPLHSGHLFSAADPSALLRQWQGNGALEEGAERPARPPLEPVVAVAADDQQVLRRLLAGAAAIRPPDWESHADGQPLRLWRLASTPLWGQLQSYLDEVQVRPLAPLPEGVPCLAAVVPLSDPGLTFKPIHRGIQGVETFQAERFLTVTSGYARVYDLQAPLNDPAGLAVAREQLASLATGNHAVLLVLPGGEGKILRFRQRLDLAQIKAAPKNPTLRSLDLALLNALVLRTVLGLQAPEEAGHPNVFAVPKLEDLVAQVQAGVFQAGFALNPPPLWEVRAVIEAGQRLPAGTLAIDPAPPSGLLFLAP